MLQKNFLRNRQISTKRIDCAGINHLLTVFFPFFPLSTKALYISTALNKYAGDFFPERTKIQNFCSHWILKYEVLWETGRETSWNENRLQNYNTTKKIWRVLLPEKQANIMDPFLIALLIGLLSGLASGAFGIGGAVITAPLLRVLLDAPGHVVVGTPLALVIPMTISSLYVFHKKNMLKWNVILSAGMSGAIFSIVGAFFTTSFTGAELMMFIAIILFMSALLLYSKIPGPSKRPKKDFLARSAAVGILVGFISGFLGIGGGTFLTPLFVLLLGLTIHEAIACSLGAIFVYAIPGTVTHLLLNHIEMSILVPLFIFSVVGAQLGSRFVVDQKPSKMKKILAGFYIGLGILLIAHEYFF
jgi:hypothetical protein